MAGTKISKILTIAALLGNSMVSANFQSVGQGVVRIDLERKYVNHGNI